MTPKGKAMESLSRIEPLILTIRGTKVILDSDLAKVYGVTTAWLNEHEGRTGQCHMLNITSIVAIPC